MIQCFGEIQYHPLPTTESTLLFHNMQEEAGPAWLDETPSKFDIPESFTVMDAFKTHIQDTSV